MEKWITKIIEHIEQRHKIPTVFETYNCYEVIDYMPTITTKVGMLNGSSNVVVIKYEK